MSVWDKIKNAVSSRRGATASAGGGAASHAVEKGLLVFHNTAEVIRAESVLRVGGFQAEVMGPPPDLRSGCDMVLVFPLMFELPVRNLLVKEHLEPLQLVPLRDLLLEPVSLFQAVRYGSFLMVRAANMKITVELGPLEQSGEFGAARIVNMSGGGCPDVPYLAALLEGKRLDEADEPRMHGKTLCSYSLQKAFEEIRRLSTEGWDHVPEADVSACVAPAPVLPGEKAPGAEIFSERGGKPVASQSVGEPDRNADAGSRRWLICGTVPDDNFPLFLGKCRLCGEKLELLPTEGSGQSRMTVEVRRGTPALLAASLSACDSLGAPAPDVLLVGDAGAGEGSRALYRRLATELGRNTAEGMGDGVACRWDGLTFHYLFPDVDGHNQVLMALDSLACKPLLVADAGFMYAAKMSGYAASYDLFTPDAGELAFLADETAPHPFYTRGFLLDGGQDVLALAKAAAAHGDSARHLLIKGAVDYVMCDGVSLGSVAYPSVPSMEPIGGTGDLITGMATAFLAAGFSVPKACFAAARANRYLAWAASPTPATSVANLLGFLPAAVRAQV